MVLAVVNRIDTDGIDPELLELDANLSDFELHANAETMLTR
jgi:hypothetical protein